MYSERLTILKRQIEIPVPSVSGSILLRKFHHVTLNAHDRRNKMHGEVEVVCGYVKFPPHNCAKEIFTVINSYDFEAIMSDVGNHIGDIYTIRMPAKLWNECAIQQWQAEELDKEEAKPLPSGRKDFPIAHSNGRWIYADGSSEPMDPRKPEQFKREYEAKFIEKKCECGIDALGGGFHSDWCPKYEDLSEQSK